jgi:hypothetical protein
LHGSANRVDGNARQLPYRRRHSGHRDIAISIRDGSRGLPLDGVEDARGNARLHADCLETMPLAVIGRNVGVCYDGASERR